MLLLSTYGSRRKWDLTGLARKRLRITTLGHLDARHVDLDHKACHRLLCKTGGRTHWQRRGKQLHYQYQALLAPESLPPPNPERRSPPHVEKAPRPRPTAGRQP